MATRDVIVEYRADPELARQATSSAKALEAGGLNHVLAADVAFDEGFAPVLLPASTDPGEATYLLRAEADDAQIETLRAQDLVTGVFSDPVIEPCLTCIDSPPVGSAADVERLLRVADLRACAMDGEGVMVAIVDGGVNVGYLAQHGKTAAFSAPASWGFAFGVEPGSVAVGHGTMCAFDACIAAPACTLADIAVLRPFSPIRSGLGALAALGADILFAAGNCGPQCPDQRCQGVSSNTIYGASAHPGVLTVAGVDTAAARVGYSSIGPG